MRRHLLTIGLILIGASGCDNVAWGGATVEVVPPPVDPEAVAVDSADAAGEGPVNLDLPILLAGVRDSTGARATLSVVGEVHGDDLRPFPDPLFPEDSSRLASLTASGAAWVLFSEGVRVGRLVAEESGTDASYCTPRTTVRGVVELVPGAAGAIRLLALPEADARDAEYGPYAELRHVYDQRVASLEIAQEAIPEYGAQWPRQGVLDARKHIQAFDIAGNSGPYVAATFLVADELVVAAPGQGAYSLFVMGEDVGGAHRGVFTWYRSVDVDGKGAPRYFDHLDWNGDGAEEILLDVLGANRRWYAGLTRRDGAWVRIFQDACGTGGSSADD